MKCKNCNAELFDSSNICHQCQSSVEKTPQYISVSTKRFVLASILTLGIFQYYWFYKNWVEVKKAENSKIMPFMRTIFPFVFCYSLFKKIDVSAKNAGYSKSLSPALLTIAFIVISFINFKESILITFILRILAHIPILISQKAADFSNEKNHGQVVVNQISNSKIFALLISAICLFYGPKFSDNIGNHIADFMMGYPQQDKNSSFVNSQAVNENSNPNPVVVNDDSMYETSPVLDKKIEDLNIAAERIRKELSLPKKISETVTINSLGVSPNALIYEYQISGENHLVDIAKSDPSFKNYLSDEVCKEVIANKNIMQIQVMFTLKGSQETFFLDSFNLVKSCEEMAAQKL